MRPDSAPNGTRLVSQSVSRSGGQLGFSSSGGGGRRHSSSPPPSPANLFVHKTLERSEGRRSSAKIPGEIGGRFGEQSGGFCRSDD